VKLKAAIRPVGEAVGEAERRRVHGRRLPEEHKANKIDERELPRARSTKVAARILSTSSTAFAARPAASSGTSGRNLSYSLNPIRLSSAGFTARPAWPSLS
jgi:hypothetical protein